MYFNQHFVDILDSVRFIFRVLSILQCLKSVVIYKHTIVHKKDKRLQMRLELMHYAKISKSSYRSIIGPMMHFEDEKEIRNKLDRKQCEKVNCNNYNELVAIEKKILKNCNTADEIKKSLELIAKKKEIMLSCKNCSHCKQDIVYKNERKKYALYHKEYAFRRLPKIATKLYLLLHFFPMIRLGTADKPYYIIYNVSTQVLSEKIGCTEASINKSIDLLNAFYYITATPGCRDKCYNIHIRDYELSYQSAANGGAGYLTLSNEILNDLLAQKNVNCLRSLCYKLLRQDDETKSSEENQTVEIPIKDIKTVLPKHINYMAKFKTCFSGDNLFQTLFDGGKCYFTLTKYHLKNDLKEFIHNSMTKIKELCRSFDFVTEDDIQNLARMTPQYDITALMDALAIIKQNYIDKGIQIHSIGAFTRRICEKRLILNLA